ncbi:MAG: ECF-type sigma factor, partial [Acidobacteriota bacterium]
LEQADVPTPGPETDPESLLALDHALRDLEARDARSAAAVTMALFGGMTVREIAEVLEISKSAVQRKIDCAKAWLRGRLDSPRQTASPDAPGAGGAQTFG